MSILKASHPATSELEPLSPGMLYMRLFAFCFLAASATGLKPALAPSTIKTRSPAVAMQYGQQQGYGQQQQGGYGQQQGMQGG